jgi:3-dehydroquinate synthetase
LKTGNNKVFDASNSAWKVSSSLPVEYAVVERNGFFSQSDYDESIFGQKSKSGITRRLIVIDHVVAKNFGSLIKSYFSRNSIEVEFLILTADEESKVVDTVFTVLNKIIDLKLQRRSEPVIAIGGGVLLDIVGLAASLYRRGIPYVRVPTTLVGLIDAGIGIKTGVNYDTHKNRIGTYYSPKSVLLDATFLSILDERHLRNGMAEVLKMALIKDVDLFSLLEESAHEIVEDKLQSHPNSQAIMRRSIQSMLEELEKNLWEKDLERLVDFGHTFSPTIEMKTLPDLLHGEAVAIDMAVCVIIAYDRNLLSEEELNRIFQVYMALGLPAYHTSCEVKVLCEALDDATSHRDGLQRVPLPKGIGGSIFVHDITDREIENAIIFLKEKIL